MTVKVSDELEWHRIEMYKLRREIEIVREELDEMRFDLKQIEQYMRLNT